MKILLIHNKYTQYGGEDAVFQAEGELLSSRGHFVERLVFDNKEFKSFGAKCLSAIHAFYNPKSARLLRKRIENFEPDIIHVHNFFPIASPSVFFVAKKYNVPIVITLHNYRLICPSAMLYHNHKIYEKSAKVIFPLDAVIRGVYANSILQTGLTAAVMSFHNLIGTWRTKVDKYIVLTQFSRSKFVNSALRLPERQFITKPNFVTDCGNGEINRRDFFLFIGRLSEEKGIEVLLRATKLYDFKLQIIGDGPFRPQVVEHARTNPNIKYLGFHDKAKIIETLKKCKALIFPSIWYEGFPVTVLEAFSTGTPVIASELGGMKEVIKNEYNGLHFKAGDEHDLVAKIKIMTERRDLLKEWSSNARKTYIENYTPEKNYNLLKNIYYQAMKKKTIPTEMITRAA